MIACVRDGASHAGAPCALQEEIATATHAARTLAAELEDVPPLLVLPLHASLPSEEQARARTAHFVLNSMPWHRTLCARVPCQP